MVSSSTLFFDECEVTEQKAFVPDIFSALFQEADRRDVKNKDHSDEVFYRAPRSVVLRRLELMGCTEDAARGRFQEWHASKIKELQEYVGEEDDSSYSSFAVDELAVLQALDWSNWRDRVPRVLKTQYNYDPLDEPIDEIDRHMKDDDYHSSWLWFDKHDSLLSIRAILSACENVKSVTLDVGGLIGGGWLEQSERVCKAEYRTFQQRGQPVSPTIIIAEGASDIEILKTSLSRLYPEYEDYFSFLDHREFKVDGGASYTVKFLKAFAAARVPTTVVAIFDNDAAGITALSNARKLPLPTTMKCIRLPDIELARSYPTVGPQGEHYADINGRACGIELYLGKVALMKDDVLRPVRWAGFDQKANTYQGEVEGKAEIQKKFREQIKHQSASKNDFPELVALWRTIFDAASEAAEALQRNAKAPKGW